MEVRPIKAWETHEWLLNKHYAKRLPPISYSFGLYDNGVLSGVCTFGDCGGATMLHTSFQGFTVIELNRLVTMHKKNMGSYFVSRAIKLLPSPIVIISYADANKGHHGYIYQALNFIYTGLSSKENIYIKDGIEHHRKSIYDKYGSSSKDVVLKNGFTILDGKPKHRYIYFHGDKRQKKEMLKSLKWDILPYPKGDNGAYDDSYEIQRQQGILF